MRYVHVDFDVSLRMMNIMMRKNIVLVLCAMILNASLLTAQINRQMKIESIEESMKINPEPEKALVIVRSQIPNLRFESNRNIDKVHEVSSGYWEVWLPAGTHLLKFDADGYERLELPAKNFGKKRTYELRILAVGFAPTSRADENLIDVAFRLHQDSVFSSYGDFAPMVSKARSITYKIPKGVYVFKFQKDGYKDEIRKLTVAQPVSQDVELVAGTSTVKFSLPGMIHITSDPAGAEIMLNGQRIGVTPYQAELTPGTHQLELRKLLHYPNISEFSLKEGETKSLALSMKPRFGSIVVTSIPEGARITIDGKYAGTSPLAKREIESGTHIVRGVMAMYDDAMQKVTVADGELKNITLTLDPAFGSLIVRSAPVDGAEVFIDGKKAGTTPFKADRLGSGKYIVTLVMPLYGVVEEELVVEVGKETVRTFALSQYYGTLTVSAPDCDLFLGEKNIGRGTYHGQLEPGRYTVRADRGEKYLPVEKNIFIKVGDNELVNLEAQARMGSVSVLVNPEEASGAEILVNNEPKGRAPLVLPLLIGDYTITARAANFLDAVQTVSVKERESIKLNMELLTYEGSRDQVRGRWAAVKWTGAAATAVAGGAALYFRAQSTANFTNYTNASTTASALAYRQKVNDNDRLYNLSLAVATAAISSAVISWIIQSVY
jgi:hypothetical protein